MRYFICIAYIIINCFTAFAQVNFKTIVPEDPIIVGEAFPVQYVFEHAFSENNCTPPAFKNFKLVSGPSVHNGNNGYPLKNTVYTLEALRPGKFIIEGASVNYNGTILKSNRAVVHVITKAEAFQRGILSGQAPSNSDLYLQPGEDPYKKINNNLFVTLTTDRKSCYVGESVTATFKLYSRLQSTSDIVKNPGFYGFTVFDVLGLKNNKIEKETVNGKQYDVHIIRKVQLYPLKAGSLTIDEMEIVNTVVFTDSPALHKVEQQIIEGIVPAKNKRSEKPGTHEYTSSIHTAPVTIQVKDKPGTNKPGDDAGATGLFTIKAELSNNELGVNEEAELIITISGKGNFTQLTAPAIQWPAGVEALDPSVVDSLNTDSSPLKGSRIFHFPFVVSKAGTYLLPSVRFSFFNPDSNTYKHVTAKALPLLVKQSVVVKSSKMEITTKGFNTYIILLSGLIILLASFLFFFLWKKREKAVVDSGELAVDTKQPLTVKEILQPALAAVPSDDTAFYSTLRQCIWKHLSDRLGVSTVINNERLSAALAGKTDEFSKKEVLQILSETETHTYGGVTSSHDKHAFYQRTLNVLEKIDVAIKK